MLDFTKSSDVEILLEAMRLQNLVQRYMAELNRRALEEPSIPSDVVIG